MQSQTPNQLSPIHKWLLAIRPKTLPAAVAPVIFGWSIANIPGLLICGRPGSVDLFTDDPNWH